MNLTTDQLDALASLANEVSSLSDAYDSLYIGSFTVRLADFPCDIDFRYDSDPGEYVVDLGQFT